MMILNHVRILFNYCLLGLLEQVSKRWVIFITVLSKRNYSAFKTIKHEQKIYKIHLFVYQLIQLIHGLLALLEIIAEVIQAY